MLCLMKLLIPLIGLPATFCDWNGSDLLLVMSQTWIFPLSVEKNATWGWVSDHAAAENCSPLTKCKTTGLF